MLRLNTINVLLKRKVEPCIQSENPCTPDRPRSPAEDRTCDMDDHMRNIHALSPANPANRIMYRTSSRSLDRLKAFPSAFSRNPRRIAKASKSDRQKRFPSCLNSVKTYGRTRTTSLAQEPNPLMLYPAVTYVGTGRMPRTQQSVNDIYEAI